jgi:hypothetical protein
MSRWSIYIDVKGFSEIYRLRQGRAIQALGELMEALFIIASKKFPTAPERLLIHQFGDGFVVVSDFMEPNPQRPSPYVWPLCATLSVGRGNESGDFRRRLCRYL